MQSSQSEERLNNDCARICVHLFLWEEVTGEAKALYCAARHKPREGYGLCVCIILALFCLNDGAIGCVIARVFPWECCGLVARRDTEVSR